MKLSVVIPMYNEEEMILLTHETVSKVLTEISQKFKAEQNKEVELEFVYINDGSKDKTLPLLKELANSDSRVKYISFSRNFGKESGILAGFQYATGDAVVLMDGDLQHPPQVVEEMLTGYFEGYDIVSARRSREGEGKIDSFFSQHFYKVFNSLMDVHISEGVSDFRLLSRNVVDSILSLPEYNRFTKGLVSWVGYKEKIIEYENQVREGGSTKFGLKNKLNYAIDAFLSFNDRPLRICVNLGLICVSLGVLYLLWHFIIWLIDPSRLISGYFTTLFAIVLFGGVQLISIGILGEYIGKIYYEVKRRPHFIVEETNIQVKDKELR
ncbi:glycosyltransferase PgfS [Globicatella sanguinis]|uniref:glycosyltransferase PgfS n=1 Tax=Globicatella sanguinis TaxID=13076 RepID=UPI002543CC00|nr:glycosyltransferase family 2 protein [Globicatella sanguinis]MDK7630146.1 glycosyltransferase family 2 protein [Globicatella sanguinis]WIK66578.1 glycosyltransferase family 2 protein [Globicatella sanguinis]WKT55983.1 glycosyltransferase family 2 protein [Globicatella sanguinis]